MDTDTTPPWELSVTPELALENVKQAAAHNVQSVLTSDQLTPANRNMLAYACSSLLAFISRPGAAWDLPALKDVKTILVFMPRGGDLVTYSMQATKSGANKDAVRLAIGEGLVSGIIESAAKGLPGATQWLREACSEPAKVESMLALASPYVAEVYAATLPRTPDMAL